MASVGAVFKAFSDFRLGDIDNSTTPALPPVAACAALVSSLVAYAVVELETQLIELKKQLVQAK